MDELTRSSSGARPGLHVPWSGLTIVLVVIAAASLGTLSVIVGIKDVDVLSTVALALAILAFAAQLIVSLAQAQGAAHQLTQTERINSETQSALAEVRSTGHALLANQSELFNKVLSAALHSATEDAVREVASQSHPEDTEDDGVEATLNAEEIADRVEAKLRNTLLSSPPAHRSTSPSIWDSTPPLSESEAKEALGALGKLTPAQIVFFVDRSREGRFTAITSRASLNLPVYKSFTSVGLLKLVELSGDRTRFLMTDKGYHLAKLFHTEIRRRPWFMELLFQETNQDVLPGL